MTTLEGLLDDPEALLLPPIPLAAPEMEMDPAAQATPLPFVTMMGIEPVGGLSNVQIEMVFPPLVPVCLIVRALPSAVMLEGADPFTATITTSLLAEAPTT